ncbi:hypothetical protein [Streptomyces rapamycinicus]|uniref:Uncharacterized protein n=1 Tax=Streptomyces rapamycinicus TaxID=1226757 RepID=A0ABR6LTJ2_9ACTN|nr:hypothetical protein [Streptomyces rapamycinicus]MBB4785648.1 hypothetical protein [Streptomyces rapamycinicus]UTO65816.1 hypothetical protein LJB45_28160 [Streptomyces rapamycinicus]UTP33771.1 hypothetical protein LIV37_33290 [Streptomyces rapamycinicus NRRL 5491]
MPPYQQLGHDLRVQGGAAAPAGPATARRARFAPRLRRIRPEPVLLVSGAALVPWLYVLARTLPSTARVGHWNVAWVGLDALEALGLLATAALRRRGDDRHRLTAAATGALLVVDAWFDTVTAAPGGELAAALAMALGAELPLAAVCTALALGRERRTVRDDHRRTPGRRPGTRLTPGRRPTRR